MNENTKNTKKKTKKTNLLPFTSQEGQNRN